MTGGNKTYPRTESAWVLLHIHIHCPARKSFLSSNTPYQTPHSIQVNSRCRDGRGLTDSAHVRTASGPGSRLQQYTRARAGYICCASYRAVHLSPLTWSSSLSCSIRRGRATHLSPRSTYFNLPALPSLLKHRSFIPTRSSFSSCVSTRCSQRGSPVTSGHTLRSSAT